MYNFTFSSCFLRRPRKLTKSSPSIWRFLHSVKSTVKISSIFVPFLGNINFNWLQKQKKHQGQSHLPFWLELKYGSASFKYIQQSLQIYQNSFGIQIGKANGLSQINYKTNTKITCFSIRSGFSIIPYAIGFIDSSVVLGVPEHPLWIWKLRKEERKKNITIIGHLLIYKANYGSWTYD